MSLRYDVKIRYTPTRRFGVCNLLNFHPTEQVTEQVNGNTNKKISRAVRSADLYLRV